MDIFKKDELRNEESLGGFSIQSETDDTFSLNGKEKYPDEISSLNIETDNYQVFAEEQPEAISNFDESEDIIEDKTEVEISENTSEDNDILNENITDENLENENIVDDSSSSITENEEINDDATFDSEESVIPKEFVDIDSSPDAVEIDINNLYPEHPSHIGIDAKTPEPIAPIPVVATKKARKLKEKKVKEKKVKEKLPKEEKEKSKRKILPILIPIAAAALLFMLLTFGDYKYGILNNNLSNALNLHKNDTLQNDKNHKEIAKSIRYQDSVLLAKALEKKQLDAKWAEKQRILDSINKQNDTISLANSDSNVLDIKKKKQDSVIALKLEKEKLNEAARLKRLEKQKAVELEKQKKQEAIQLALLEKKKRNEADRLKRLEKQKANEIALQERRNANEAAKLKRQDEKLKKLNTNKSALAQKKNDLSVNDITKNQQKLSNSDELYVVQVYSSPSRQDAEQWLKKVKVKVGSQANITTQVIRDVTWYRVRFGNYKTRAEAEKAAQQTGFSQSWIDRIK